MSTMEKNGQQYPGGVPMQTPERQDSYFDGTTWQRIGYRLLSFFVCTITLGIAYPWMLCMMQRWEAKHTVIHGRRLCFNGKGHQIIGKYLLWILLTVITFGIYGIWFGLGMKKWVVKHTVYADEESPVESYFTGGAGGYLGIHLIAWLLTGATFGIGRAWADIEVLKWEAKHTHIGGSPLEFNGSGGPLFVKYLLLGLLTPLTLGIYAIFWPVIYMKWEIQNTEAVYQTPRIQSQANAHVTEAVKDYAKFHIAAAEQEISAIRSGFTGKESREELENMAQSGNPFACCRMAQILKGDAPVYEGQALEYLQTAADGKVHSALYALAQQLPAEQSISVFTEAARCGSAEATWVLAEHYLNTGDMFPAAYWFRLAIEWERREAMVRHGDYDRLVKNIALKLSEEQAPKKSSHMGLKIALGVVGGLIALAVIGSILALVRTGRLGITHSDSSTGNIINPFDNHFAEKDWQGSAVDTDAAALSGEWNQIVCEDDRLQESVWLLNNDGTLEMTVRIYYPASEDGWTDLYYGGRKWYAQWEEEAHFDGTYWASEEEIIFYYNGTEDRYTITYVDGKPYIGDGWVKASPLVGTWMNANMETNEYETRLDVTSLTVDANGRFNRLDRFYIRIEPGINDELYLSPVESTHWGIPGVGFPSTYGTYELNQSELTLHTLWDDVGNGDYDDYDTRQVEYLSEGTILLDGQTYYKGTYTVTELCELFDIPTN